jgi:hypothetical protein
LTRIEGVRCSSLRAVSGDPAEHNGRRPIDRTEVDDVDESILTAWRRELESARARAARLVDASERADELVARWLLTEEAVVWWVETDASEPDVDLEDVGGAIVVRVRRAGERAPARAVLPIPPQPVVHAIAVEFREGGVEVRLLLESH